MTDKIPTPEAVAELIERIKALADCAYWANVEWVIPGDATQAIGRLAIKAAAMLSELSRALAEVRANMNMREQIQTNFFREAMDRAERAESKVREQAAEIERLTELLCEMEPHWTATTKRVIWTAAQAGVMASIRMRLDAAIAAKEQLTTKEPEHD